MKTFYVPQCLAAIAAAATICAQQAQATPVSCQSLTPSAIQHTVTQMNASLAQANSDFNINGVTGAYASAAKSNRDLITLAHDNIVHLQTWLKNEGLDSPYVTNASASYNVYGYMRESISYLHTARHWAAISAVYHSSQAARQSIELTTQALSSLELVSAQATRCYVDQYGPFTR